MFKLVPLEAFIFKLYMLSVFLYTVVRESFSLVLPSPVLMRRSTANTSCTENSHLAWSFPVAK